MSAHTSLAARLRRGIADMAPAVNRVSTLLARTRKSGDDAYLDGVALNLHGFYTGVERELEAIARDFDGSVPSGDNWHRDLLQQMAAEVANSRPAVLQASTRACLGEYLGFRHVVRSVYTFNLRPERVVELADGLPSCFDQVKTDLDVFAGFLDGLDPSFS